MKYIIYKNGFAQNKVVLWSDAEITHVAIMDEINREDSHEVMSAGFLNKNEHDEIECYGESTSLKVKSHPEIDEGLMDFVLRSKCGGRCDEKN